MHTAAVAVAIIIYILCCVLWHHGARERKRGKTMLNGDIKGLLSEDGTRDIKLWEGESSDGI